MKKETQLLFWLLCCLLILTACQGEPEQQPTDLATQAITEEQQATATRPTPSETPIPLAAQVNDSSITLSEFEAEMERYRSATGTEPTNEDVEKVIQEMVDQLLLAQAAAEAGFQVDQAMLEARIEQLGLSPEALQTWQDTYGYTQEQFEASLSRAIAAAWMRDEIIAKTSETAEQVHARQVLLYNSDEAETALNQLNAGADFETLAEQYDPVTRGDLGWFPRGYLTVSELDEVVFTLEPGEHSDVIETALGFHIVQVVEREEDRPLSPDAYRMMQAETLAKWLQERRQQSEITLYVP
jgi:peptidyl-prolyl cis-trans isomerase C